MHVFMQTHMHSAHTHIHAQSHGLEVTGPLTQDAPVVGFTDYLIDPPFEVASVRMSFVLQLSSTRTRSRAVGMYAKRILYTSDKTKELF